MQKLINRIKYSLKIMDVNFVSVSIPTKVKSIMKQFYYKFHRNPITVLQSNVAGY